MTHVTLAYTFDWIEALDCGPFIVPNIPAFIVTEDKIAQYGLPVEQVRATLARRYPALLRAPAWLETARDVAPPSTFTTWWVCAQTAATPVDPVSALRLGLILAPDRILPVIERYAGSLRIAW